MAITGISYASYAYAAATQSYGTGAGGSASSNSSTSSSPSSGGATTQGAGAVSDTGQQLTPDQQQEVAKLKTTDQNVRKHEQAHLAVAGDLAISGASYTYQRGPDGQTYAVGGEVSIDVSPGQTPEETVRKAEQIQRAALAPADPSGQDRSVAAQAASMEADARAKLATGTAVINGTSASGAGNTGAAGAQGSSGNSVSRYYSSNGGNRFVTATGAISAYA